jgi:arginine deiminase
MRITQIVNETSAGATGSGSVATVSSPLGATQTRNASIYGDKKVGNLLKGKKTNKPFANSVSEGKKVDEAKLDEDDIIIVPGQKIKRKTGFVQHGQSRVDHEVEMARSDVLATMKNAKAIYELHGIKVHETPTYEIGKMGGSLACMTLPILRKCKQ